jgi:hypothetical protein
VIAIKKHHLTENDHRPLVLATIDNMPTPASVIEENDFLIVIGHEDALKKLGEVSDS